MAIDLPASVKYAIVCLPYREWAYILSKNTDDEVVARVLAEVERSIRAQLQRGKGE